MDFSIFIQLLVYSTPVALAAMGEGIGQKGGVMNIGLEGTMLSAAFGGAVVAIATHSPALGLLAGTAVGLAVTLVAAVFSITLASDQVVVGTAVNLGVLGITGTLFRNQFGQSGKLISIPSLPELYGIDAVIPILLALAIALWFAVNRTTWGLALRAVGEYPKAAESSGFSITRLRYAGCAIAGILGGLGGAYLSIGVANSFAENMTGGRGFVAIAMVTFGRWKSVPILIASVLVGGLDVLQFRFQAMGLKVPFQLFVAMPYIVALAVLVIVGRGTAAPASLGKAHQESK